MPDRFIREPECAQITGLSRVTRWRLERRGDFPKRRQISPNAMGWLESELMSWMKARAEGKPFDADAAAVAAPQPAAEPVVAPVAADLGSRKFDEPGDGTREREAAAP